MGKRNQLVYIIRALAIKYLLRLVYSINATQGYSSILVTFPPRMRLSNDLPHSRVVGNSAFRKRLPLCKTQQTCIGIKTETIKNEMITRFHTASTHINSGTHIITLTVLQKHGFCLGSTNIFQKIQQGRTFQETHAGSSFIVWIPAGLIWGNIYMNILENCFFFIIKIVIV